MHVATVIPPSSRGSGGHSTIFTLLARLERAWPHLLGLAARPTTACRAGAVRPRRIIDEFVPLRAPAHMRLRRLERRRRGAGHRLGHGVPTVLLPGCRARAYLIQDHEPDFFATSAESIWAEGPTDWVCIGITASRWLHDLVRAPLRPARHLVPPGRGPLRSTGREPVERRRDTVDLLRARGHTAARLPARRARAGGAQAPPSGHADRAVRASRSRCRSRSSTSRSASRTPRCWRGTTRRPRSGLCLSLTNYSLIPQEMLACGLPCVDLVGGSTEAEAGDTGGMEFAEADPVGARRRRWRRCWTTRNLGGRSQAGLEFAQTASWDLAAPQVESGLREALREREPPAGRGFQPATAPAAEASPRRGLHRAARRRLTGGARPPGRRSAAHRRSRGLPPPRRRSGPGAVPRRSDVPCRSSPGAARASCSVEPAARRSSPEPPSQRAGEPYLVAPRRDGTRTSTRPGPPVSTSNGSSVLTVQPAGSASAGRAIATAAARRRRASTPPSARGRAGRCGRRRSARKVPRHMLNPVAPAPDS